MSNLNNFLNIKKLCHRFKKRGKPKRKIAQGKGGGSKPRHHQSKTIKDHKQGEYLEVSREYGEDILPPEETQKV